LTVGMPGLTRSNSAQAVPSGDLPLSSFSIYPIDYKSDTNFFGKSLPPLERWMVSLP
jgi:hypothetical protein